ncbi:mechanosensitive ion channel domain-containing protein [Halorussus sp. MSC15.2]|uniref:mechanosensitive ion channel family protein n=1 Tax=Halorussus sp. MSC15.2 TaxID=2283638 RepID=UPI0013D15B57|nr:mechanosensitive ion channel [Halorussus sp. MSC15.2]
MATEALAELRAGFVDAVPKVVTALLFFVVAYAAIRLALSFVRSAFGRIYADDLIADLFTAVVGIFLWFGAALALLKILGMGEVAASLGTATGFVALGVSYALSDMIADTVSGVYLLRDADFNPGDRVETAGVTGVVREIDLRKSRMEVEGDVVVLGNRSVEKQWRKKADPASGPADESATDVVHESAANESVK